MSLPDFKSSEERDKYFCDHAEYFSVVAKNGVGRYERNEYTSLEDAIKAAQTHQTISGGGWMIYGIIGEQSAFIKAIPPVKTNQTK